MKRVVTDVAPDGASIFSQVGEPGTVVRFGPGFEVHEVWRVDEPPHSVRDGYDPAEYVFEPDVGVIFRVVVIPPDEVVLASLVRGERWGANSPYRSTSEDFGLHTSSTQDLVSVVSGRVDLRLPDGREERLETGDVVVQRGAEHAWRNPGPDSVVLHVVMLGVAN